MLGIVRLVGLWVTALLLALQPVGVLWSGHWGPMPPQSAQSLEVTSVSLERSFGQLPLYFVENQGQVDPRVAYYIQGSDKTIYFTPQGLTLALSGPAEQPITSSDGVLAARFSNGYRSSPLRDETPPRQRWVVKLGFLGANPGVRPQGLERTGATISYFRGSPEQRHTGLPTYARIVYRELWPGIDLFYYGTANRLKYDFVVHPGADPAQIRLAYSGASAVWLDKAGRLQVSTPLGGFSDEAPVAYQEGEGGQRLAVTAAYTVPAKQEAMALASQTYSFQVGPYDRNKPLVLDPVMLVYCGYLGGSGDDRAYGIDVDAAGNAYVSGQTSSSETTFPERVGPDRSYNGNYDTFVAKVNAAGTALIYCGYIGGSGEDAGYSIAVDGAGNAYVTGYTASSETTFPVKVGPDLSHNDGQDAFVAKLNAAGTALIYCGYIGGSRRDTGRGIAVDGAGNAYVTGDTESSATTFPVAVGPDLSRNGGQDAFVAKVNAAGTALLYCGYIGGSNSDGGNDIAVDGAGNVYVTGGTESSETTFPVKVGPDLSYNDGEANGDAFVAKVDASGAVLLYCGYLGGSSYDYGRGIAVDGVGNAYVTGQTSSGESTFPVTIGPDLSYSADWDAFVAKVNASGANLLYCGYLGGSGDDRGYDIVVDGAGNAYVTGDTESSEATFPATGGPDKGYNGGIDIFVARVNAIGTALHYRGYIGGPADDSGRGIAVDGAGNAYVTGRTNCSVAPLPVTIGPDLSCNGGLDALVARVSSVSGMLHLPVLVHPNPTHTPTPHPNPSSTLRPTPTSTPRPTQELHYDDGTSEGYQRLRAAAVRFCVGERRQVVQLKYCLKGQTGPVQLAVYDANWLVTYRPPSSVTPGPLVADDYRWWSYDIPIEVTAQGCFYVAMVWPSAGAGPHLGADQDAPDAGGSYGSWDRADPPFGPLTDPAVDLMIRAVVR